MKSFESEIKNWSLWFKISIATIFVVYLGFWLFSISTSNFQIENGIKPQIPVMAQDSEGYYNLSESLINGQGFSQHSKTETLRTPGYPVFAAIIKTIGRSYFAVTLVQILLVFGAALVIRKIGIFLHSQKVGEIAALLFLANPVTLTLSLAILTDTLFLFLVVLGIYLTLSLNNEKLFLKAFIVSLVFGAAIYTRLGLFVIPALLTPILAINIDYKAKLKLASTTLVLLMVLILPWVFRNYIRVGVVGYTSFRSQNLGWAATKFLSSRNGTSQGEEYEKMLMRIGIKSSDYYDIRYSDQIGRVAEEIVFEEPLSYARYHIVSSLPFLFPSTISFARDTYYSAIHKQGTTEEGAIGLLSAGKWREFIKSIMRSWWKVFERLGWLAGYSISLFGIWQYRKKVLPWVFVFVIGYLMMLAGPASGPRYTFQAMPFMFSLFALGGVCLFNKIKETS